MPQPEEIRRLLRQRLSGRLTVVGIGNAGRGDDRAGLRVARLLRRLATPGGPGPLSLADVIEAHTSPEAYAGAIAASAPETVLLVDAADLSEPPGAVALVEEADLAERPGWEVHRPPLALLMRYLALRTGARVLLLAIQPKDTSWGAPMSPAVRRSTGAVVRGLLAALKEGQGCTN